MAARKSYLSAQLLGFSTDPAAICTRIFSLLFVLASPAFAELPVARMTAIFPPGGRAGSHFDVAIMGTELDGPIALRFSRPGITAKPATDSSGATERKFTVLIDSDVPIGECEVRFLGAYGISNPRAFAVSSEPEIVRSAGSKPGERTALPVGSVVSARATASAIDSYSVEIKQGQRVLFDCAAGLIDSKFSPVLLLHDEAGHEVERSRHGGLLDFTAPSEGTYTLQIHDVLYRGGVEYFYRLEASIRPHIDAIFPPVGNPGSNGTYTLYGRNLPGGTQSDRRALDGKRLEQLEIRVELPETAPDARLLDAMSRAGTSGWSVDSIPYRLPSEIGFSNPVLIGLTESPVVVEQDPNETPAQAQRLAPPVDVAGRFYPRGDKDWFKFDAAKGDVYWIEIISQRMALPTNPLVLVQRVTHDEKGVEQTADLQAITGAETNIGGPAFRTSTRDGAFRLDAREGGTYRLMVRDLFNTSVDNPALTYRLSIRKEQPDFQFLVLPLAAAVANEVPLWSPFLRQGGALPMRLIVARRQGFTGEVRVSIEGLPDGLKCAGTTIGADQTTGTMVITSDDHSAQWCGPLRIVGRAKTKDADVTRTARVGAVIWPANVNTQELAISRLAEDFNVAVSGDEQEPITFVSSDKPFEVAVGGKVQIPITIHRNMGFNTPIKITTGGLAALATVKELTLAPDASTGTLEIDVAQQKLGVGTYAFFLQAEGQVAYPRRTFPLPENKVAVKKRPQALSATSYSSLLTLNVVPGGTVKDK